jgi:ornithine carbamoyltransferase
VKKDILTLLDLTSDDFEQLFNKAIQLKKRYKQGIPDNQLQGKTVGLLFDKASTRTRVSFEAATAHLGGTSMFINAGDTQISRNEPVKDTARILSGYLDALVIRTYSQAWLEEFAQSSDIPVINALTDSYHPTQVLADLMTVIEHKPDYKNLKISWVGDGNNMCYSWINAAIVLGLNLSIASPEKYSPDKGTIKKDFHNKNTIISYFTDPVEAVKDADVINTDVWASMGQENEQKQRVKELSHYQVNNELLKHAKNDVIVMHCLPAHRGEEITDDVLEGSNSVVWDQAENKLHMAKAILEALLTG